MVIEFHLTMPWHERMSRMLLPLMTRFFRSSIDRTRSDLAPLFLLLVAAAFMSRALLSGGIVLAGDVIFYWYPWLSVAPTPFQASNPILTDPVVMFHPWQLFTVDMLTHGKVPLWNPYVGGGAPFVGNDQSHVFFPFNMLYYVLPFQTASTLSFIFILFFAGLFMYEFAKLAGVSRFGGTVSAISYMLSGTMILWLQFPLALAAMLAPAVLLACEKLVVLPGTRSLAVLATVTALELLAGQAEISVLCLGSAILYTLYRVSTQKKRASSSLKSIACLAFGIVLGFGISAIQILPFYEYLTSSLAYMTRGSVNWYFLRPEFMLTNFVPNLFGNPVAHNYWHPEWNYNEINGAYVGPVSLMLALMAWLNTTQRSRALFFYALALLSFGIVYRVPGLYEAVRAIPFLGLMDLLRFLFIAAFSLSVLAGIGANGLTQGNIRPRTAPILSVGLILAVSVGLWICSTIAPRVLALKISTAIANFPTGPISPLLRYVAQNILSFAVLALLTGVISWTYVRNAHSRRSRVFAQGLILVLILVGLFSFGFQQNPVVPIGSVYPTYPVTPAIEFLRNDSTIYRIAGVGCCVLPPNTGMMYGIQDFRMPLYADALLPATYAKFEEAAFGPVPDSTASWNIELLSLANVKYVLTPPGSSFESLQSSMMRVYHGPDADIYLNKNVMPRAFIVFNTFVARNDQEAFSAIQRVDLRKNAVLTESLNLVATSGAPEGNATIREYEDALVTIDTYSSQNALLVFTDTYFVGWSAFVDGHATRILRVDYTFRGVLVPPGSHVVKFSYEPGSFSLGLQLSIVSILVTIIALSLGSSRTSRVRRFLNRIPARSDTRRCS
jgi:hypothetical protein